MQKSPIICQIDQIEKLYYLGYSNMPIGRRSEVNISITY